MSSPKNAKFFYFFLAPCITATLMFFKNSNIFGPQSNFLRNLITASQKNYLCDKSGSDLLDKYKTDFYEESIKKKSLTDSQKAIIVFARDDSYSNIKPFVKKCAIFIVFIVLDIILLGLWISYCGCCCCKCCLFGAPSPSKTCSWIFFVVAVICNLLVIAFSITVIILLSPLFKRINGLGCSALQALDHARYGLAPDYTNRAKEWIGVVALMDTLTASLGNIQNQGSLFDGIDNAGPIFNEVCPEEYATLKNDTLSLKLLAVDSLNVLAEQLVNLQNYKNIYDYAEKNIAEDIYDIIKDHANKWVIRLYKSFFILSLIFGILGLGILIIFLCNNNKCLRIV